MAGFDFILCADDYGMTEAVSRGLLEVAAAGRISAASAMASLPDWRRAARDWAAARPPVDLGLHVTLTVGAPLGAMPQFAPGEWLALTTCYPFDATGRSPLRRVAWARKHG